jgi:hypothetical protein
MNNEEANGQKAVGTVGVVDDDSDGETLVENLYEKLSTEFETTESRTVRFQLLKLMAKLLVANPD